jgi:hypothetical protein
MGTALPVLLALTYKKNPRARSTIGEIADPNSSYAPVARHDAMLDEVAAELNAEDCRSSFTIPFR